MAHPHTGSAVEPTTVWPELPYPAWKDTCATLHLWTQIIGKIRLSQTPRLNHSWHVTLYVTARGLTTSPMAHGTRTFQIEMDFIAHRLLIEVSDGSNKVLQLEPRSRRRLSRGGAGRPR
jgi:hypothetical protein